MFEVFFFLILLIAGFRKHKGIKVSQAPNGKGSTNDPPVCARDQRTILHCLGEISSHSLKFSQLHGFAWEGQVLNFLDGLTTSTRTWVEEGTGTISFYDLTTDEACFQLAKLASYIYQLWNPQKTYRDFEEEANNLARWQEPSSL